MTARHPDGTMRILLVAAPRDPERINLASWQVHGMRCSRSGTVDFTGLPAGRDAAIGPPDVYAREPELSGGAWRFVASRRAESKPWR